MSKSARLQKLTTKPTVQELQALLPEVGENRDFTINLIWSDKTANYLMTVRQRKGAWAPEWRMSQGAGADAKELWVHVTNDVFMIYSMVSNQCGGFDPVGGDASQAVQAPGQTPQQQMPVGVTAPVNPAMPGGQSFPPLQNTPVQPAAGMGTGFQLNPSTMPQPAAQTQVPQPGQFAPTQAAAPAPGVAQAPITPDWGQPQGAFQNAAQIAPGAGAGSAFSGDLGIVRPENLLQSIKGAGLTGRLHLTREKQNFQLFFENGSPTHATGTDGEGVDAVYEIVGWKEGLFHFEPGTRTDRRSISLGVDTLLLQGFQLIDHANFLTNVGLRPDSVLMRNWKNLPAEEFEQAVASGAPIDLRIQRDFYEHLDGKKTWMEILAKLGGHHNKWIPVLANLLKCNLVSIINKKESRSKNTKVQAKQWDKSLVEPLARSLCKPETGLYTYSSFLHFADREFRRHGRFANGFSIILLELRVNRGGPMGRKEPLAGAALMEAILRLKQLIRDTDMLCHYETFDFALLLPETRPPGAAVLGYRLVKTLLATPLVPDVNSSNLMLAVGVASLPEDMSDVPNLIAAAEMARDQARVIQPPIMLYRDCD